MTLPAPPPPSPDAGQRSGSAGRPTPARPSRRNPLPSRPCLLLALLPLLACAHRPAAPAQAPAAAVAAPETTPVAEPETPPPAGPDPGPRLAIVPLGLRLRVSPPDATLELNGQDRGAVSGAVAREALRELPSGIHRIVLRREGFQSWRGEVSVSALPQVVEVTLPPAGEPTAEDERSHGAAP